MSVAHRNLPGHVKNCPEREVQGYGSMRYTPNGYFTGHLPGHLARTLSDLRTRQRHIPMIYSYSTPIAWFDREHGVWVRPDVSYSVTTAKQQGHLYVLDCVLIPRDCGLEEYRRYVSRQMVYTRTGTIPGPAFVPEC